MLWDYFTSTGEIIGLMWKHQGVGLLSQFPPFRYFPNFSALSKHQFVLEYHVYIWQVSPQLSCGDSCQIWMWLKESNSYFCKIENFAYGEINERSFSNPHPRAANLQKYVFRILWKNVRIFNNFSVSLNLFLIRLKTVIMATFYLLWWDPLAPSGNSSGFFRYYRNRKWGRACVTTTCGREKNECFCD